MRSETGDVIATVTAVATGVVTGFVRAVGGAGRTVAVSATMTEDGAGAREGDKTAGVLAVKVVGGTLAGLGEEAGTEARAGKSSGLGGGLGGGGLA